MYEPKTSKYLTLSIDVKGRREASTKLKQQGFLQY